MKILIKAFIFLLIFYIFIPFTNAYMQNMILNENQSILLPNFDTSAITGNNISEIGLNLYIQKFTNKTQNDSVHLTVNQYDPKTNIIRDGLSAIYHPEANQYLEIKLPKSLFEEIIGTNERLLLKIVGKDQELIFSSSETTGTEQDPFLTVTYSEGAPEKTDNTPTPVIINNFNFGSINNSQIHYGTGDNVAMNKNINSEKNVDTKSEESFIGKFFWYFIVGIAVLVIGTFITYKLGFANQPSIKNSQIHYGGGDNINGDKNIILNEKSK